MPQIDVRVATAADGEAELRSLLRWLKADEDTGRSLHGELRSGAPAHPEHLGATLDLIALAVGGGLSAAQLTLAVHQWRTTRRTAPRVTLRRGSVEVEIEGADEETVRAVADLLDRGRDDDGGAA